VKKISVIIPCYNEEAVLPQLFQRLAAVAGTWGTDCEMICVDDGSRDRTWELSFARNFGHQVAVSAGLYHATGDAMVILDADLQDPPEQISRLLEKWREGFQVVYAVRTKRDDAKLKQFLAWGFYRIMSRLASFDVPADAGDFCLLDQRVVEVINALPERNRYLRGLRAWSGFRQIGIEFERHARAAGAPQYTFKKSFRLAMDGVFSFSTVPLRLATCLGLGVSAVAFLGAVFTFLEKIFAAQFAKFGFTPGPHGIPTTVISILFLGGVQLICLGILGEYLGRIYDEVKGRPHWVIQDYAGLDAKTIPKHHPK